MYLLGRIRINVFVSRGYCGVLLCDDEEGNRILRRMEGKTHTEWDPNLCMTIEDTKLGKKAIEEMNKFIFNCWKDYRSKHFPESIELRGLNGLSGLIKQVGKKPINRIKPGDPNEIEIQSEEIEHKTKSKKIEIIGVRKEGLSSIKEHGKWKYNLTLHSDHDKAISIRMLPSTDSVKTSKEEVLQINEVSNHWNIQENIISGKLKKGNNIIEFYLNSPERVGLDFKLKIDENAL